MFEAFVYSLRNIKTNRLYIGWHKGHIDDGYICSSKLVLEEYHKDPSIFERYIISRSTVDQMVKLEVTILKAVDAMHNKDYYNQHNGSCQFVCKGHTEITKAKISKGNTGNKRPDLTKRNLENNPGKSAESRKKLSEFRKTRLGPLNENFGKKASDETRHKMSNNRKGKCLGVPKTQEVKDKMSAARKIYWDKKKGLI